MKKITLFLILLLVAVSYSVAQKSVALHSNETTTIFVGETTYKFSRKKSIRFEAQHLWTKDDKKDWIAATTEFNFSPKFSVFVTDMYNYGNELKKIHYYNVGGSYTNGSARVALNYGRQRGGLLCIGGVCRIVPESTGIGMVLNVSF